MTTRGAEGTIRGRIRVDARRAIEKLRAHQLLDLHLYLAEIARAAVAGGARTIDVRADADDVWIAFDGAPFAPRALTRLLDHVLGDADDAEARRLRWLAIGVNAALGLDAAHVDVLVADPESPEGAVAVRWTPALGAAGLDAPAEDPEPFATERPAWAHAAVTVVRVHKRAGWSLVRRAIASAPPPEIARLAEATHELDAAVTLGGEPLPRPPRAPALVRVPFDVRGVRRACLELLPADATPSIEWREQGVRLVEWRWEPSDLPRVESARALLPARVVIDAEQLPTNASRSAIRGDGGLVAQVDAAARSALDAAIAALGARLRGESIEGEAVVLAEDTRVLEDAAGALACVLAADPEAVARRSEAEKALLELPLLADATGAPRSVASALRTPPYAVVRGGPLEAPELAPWLRGVLLQRGRVADRLLLRTPEIDHAALVARAGAALERRARHHARPPTAPRVPATPTTLARAPLHVARGDLAGLEGEVAVHAGADVSTIRIFVEGRPFAAWTLDRARIPLPIDAALEHPTGIVPSFDWARVEATPRLETAIAYAAACGAAIVAVLARQLDALEPEHVEAARALVRAACATLARPAFARTLDDAEGARRALADAPVWPTSEPGRFASIAEIAARAGRSRAVCTAPPGTTGRAPDGRPVVALFPRERAWLLETLGAGAVCVPYAAGLRARAGDPALRARDALERTSPEMIPGPRCGFAQPHARGVIAVARRTRLVELHAGVVLGLGEHVPTLGAVAIAIDDDTTVPTPEWDGARDVAPRAWLADVERDLCATIVGALEGDAAAAQCLDRPLSIDAMPSSLFAYLVDSARVARLTGSSQAGDAPAMRALADRLEALPLLWMTDANGTPVPASLAAIRARHPGPVPYLAMPPGFATFDAWPVIVPTDEQRDVLARWADGPLLDATAELPAWAARAERETARRTFLAREEQDPRALGGLGDARATIVETAAGLPPGIACVTAGLPLRPLGATGLGIVVVLYARRALLHLACPAPVVALVELAGEPARLDALPPDLEAAVQSAAEGAAFALAHALVDAAAVQGRSGALFEELRALELVARLLAAMPRDEHAAQHLELGGALRASDLRFPTVQGGAEPLVSLYEKRGELWFGRARHVPWRDVRSGRRAPLDKPVLHLPDGAPGEALAAMLGALGLRLRDATAEVAALQSRRAGAGPAEAPRLSGDAPHPALRATFASLGVDLDGELELVAAPPSALDLVDADGKTHALAPELPIPVRAVVRVETAGPNTIELVTREVTRAALRRVKDCGEQLDELPAWMRDHVRAALCASAARSRIGAKASRLRVFVDTRGAWHALETLRDHRPVAWTRDPPPYPEASYVGPVLRLTESEAAGLGRQLELEDVTALMRLDRDAEARRTAPGRERLELSAEERARCVVVAKVAEGTTTGEVGVLLPGAQDARGVRVHVGKRPLCAIEDGLGWPLFAIVDDADAKPSRLFDRLERAADGEAIVARVRAAAIGALRRVLAPPAEALASTWIEAGITTSGGTAYVVGSIWLPSRSSDARVQLATTSEPAAPLVANAEARTRFVRGVVPVAGNLLVAPPPGEASPSPALRARIAELALARATALVEEARAHGAPEAIVDEYGFWLALLGEPPIEGLAATAGDGARVPAADVLRELEARGSLATTRQRGTALGEFPDGAPAFVLLDPSPVVAVLRALGEPSRLRELGGLEPSAPPPEPAAPDDAAPDTDEEGLRWIDRARRALGKLLGRAEPAPPPRSATDVAAAVLVALHDAALTGDPVIEVRVARGGRPVRFDAAARAIVIDGDHEALADDARHEQVTIALTAAALAEVNRALGPVTDDEERRALVGLLERIP